VNNIANPAAGDMTRPIDPALITYTNIIYALHALAVLFGIAGIRTVSGSFVFSLPSLVAVIMNYARRAEVRGTFLDSHFSWQIRTFWFTVVWLFVIWCVSLPLMLVLVGFATLFVGKLALAVWIVYRVVRGWMALREGRPMYA
jgi:uncharacterized membrane protein